MSSPLATQLPILTNRFLINLRSLNTHSSSQSSSGQQHWSGSSAYFHISDSFLGNIGEDLWDGHEPADNDLEGRHESEADTVCFNTWGSSEAELEETSTTPGSSTARPEDAQVSLQIPSGSKQY